MSARALLARSLRLQSRAAGGHAARTCLAALLLLSLLSQRTLWSMGGAAGVYLLDTVVWMLAMIATVTGIALFSSAVTDEKEEGNLGLLRMAGLGAGGLLAGVGLARLWDLLLLCAIAIPPCLLAITLGGVDLWQVAAAFTAIVAYLVLLAGLGLLASTVSATGARAGALMILALLALHLGPVLLRGLLTDHPWAAGAVAACDWWLGQTVWGRLGRISSTGYSGGLLSAQLAIDTGLGTLCLLAAWRLFPSRAIDSHEAGDTGGQRWRFAMGAAPTGLRALAWKDFHTVCGGWTMLAIKGLVAIVAAGLLAWSMDNVGTDRAIAVSWMVVGIGWLVVESGLHLSRLYAAEVREHTAGILLTLPHSAATLAYAKLRALGLALLPAAVLTGAGIAMAPDKFVDGVGGVLGSGFGWYAVSMVVLFLHLAAWFSLRFARFALAGAVVTSIVLMFVTSMVMAIIGRRDAEAFFGLAAAVTLVVSAGFHVTIARRWAAAAARD